MLESLNAEQKAAVRHKEGPLLVVAGAGSGKTRIVTHRIAYLLQMGVPASSIVAVTFTNKAAEEMGARVRRVTAQTVLTCTFHALGAQILRESIHVLGYGNTFAIYDEGDSLALIKNCLETLGMKDDKGAVRHAKNEISRAKNDQLRAEEYQDDEKMQHVYAIYQKKLREYNALDFDDLLFLTVELFQKHPDVLTRYQERWQYILIDEYQDTNHSQYLMVKQLAAKHKGVFAVGDPDQSIYSWRGANIRNILSFEEDFPGAKVVKLEQNYRSTTHILGAANGLIANNTRLYRKDLWSELGNGEKVDVRIYDDERDEMAALARLIASHYRSGISLNEMVVFYRTNAQSRSIEDALLKSRIPYLIVGGLSFYQRKEIKDILAWLRCAVCPSDFMAFVRAISFPKRGVGPALFEKLQVLSEARKAPIVDVCRDCSDVKMSQKQRDGINAFLKIIDQIHVHVKEKIPLSRILQEVILGSSYLEALKEDEETYQERAENLEALVSKAAEWEVQAEMPTLSAFLEELSLKAEIDPEHANEVVRLMTLHHGKGLEFNFVFITGLEEGLLPHINSQASRTACEEERRLFYVGITRAKKRLYLSACRCRFIWGTVRGMTVSRFLEELPPHHLHWHEHKHPESRR